MPVSAMLIASFSVMLTSAVVGNAFFQKKQFYPSVVYLTKSNVSLAVIYTQAFVLVMFVGKLMRRVFFGQLRTAEFEHLMERAWYAVTETCLAFTMFRDDLSPKFVALFTVLLFLKSFHWLVEDRIDFMERSPVISWLFHIRAISLLTLLTVLDLGFVEHACQYTLSQGASVQLVFGFEYAILLTAVAYVLVKYALHTLDARRDAPWEHKAVYLLYAELMINFLKVLLYLVFTAIMVKIHTLPLFAIRPMYSALRSFKKALSDVVLSRRAIHIMNTLYQDATPEQLSAGDNVCIICREEMTPESTAKRLPCGHMFHVLCLRSWFQRQQTCPTCRMDILRNAAAPTAPAAEPPAAPAANAGPAAAAAVNFQQLFNWPFPAAPPAAAAAAAAPAGPQTAPQPPLAAAFMPPPPFPMFMAPPIPAPSAAGVDLSGVSDVELRAMEGRERRAVEARIRHLRDVQTLLDAAVLLMQQYARVSPVSDDDGGSAAATVKSEPTASAAKSASQESPPEVKSPVTDERGAATAPISPQEELRQRRMRHFQAGGD